MGSFDKNNIPSCNNHQPQTTGFPWAYPGGLVTWCPECGTLEVDGEYAGVARLDPNGTPEDWLFQPVTSLKWASMRLWLPAPKLN